jgi:hypothetical protein
MHACEQCIKKTRNEGEIKDVNKSDGRRRDSNFCIGYLQNISVISKIAMAHCETVGRRHKINNKVYVKQMSSLLIWLLFFKVLIKTVLFEWVLMVFTVVGSLFVKNILNKVSACFYEITY